MTTEEKAQRYDEISKEVKDFFDGKQKMYSDVEQTLNYLFPELRESEDERIREKLISLVKNWDKGGIVPKYTSDANDIKQILTWLEKQGNSSKECLNLPHFTFDDVLALQCCMETVKKVQEDKELYEQLQNLHNRLHDAYWLEKQGDSNNQNWKPSKGQIDALEHFVRSIGESGYASPYDDNTKLLKSLINDLYKLLENQSEQEEPQVYDTGDGDIITYSETEGYNVEPKLKIERGKWYVCIKNLLDDYGNIAFCKGDVYLSEKDEYLIPSNSNVPWMIAYCVDTYFKEWTIKDAKDGDVLSNGKMIVIFKHFEEPSYRQRIVAYIGLDNNGDIQITDDTWTLGIDKANPATKEQRDLLFQKMKEDGYEWDAEKKELKKIEQPKLTVIKDMMDDYRDDIDKHAWSVEDSSKVQRICKYLDEAKKYYADITEVRECIEWLKSIEDRVQPQQKWTEEDENGFGETLWAINKARTIAENENDMGNLWYAENWLKSLKERLS